MASPVDFNEMDPGFLQFAAALWIQVKQQQQQMMQRQMLGPRANPPDNPHASATTAAAADSATAIPTPSAAAPSGPPTPAPARIEPSNVQSSPEPLSEPVSGPILEAEQSDTKRKRNRESEQRKNRLSGMGIKNRGQSYRYRKKINEYAAQSGIDLHTPYKSTAADKMDLFITNTVRNISSDFPDTNWSLDDTRWFVKQLCRDQYKRRGKNPNDMPGKQKELMSPEGEEASS